MGNKCWLTLVLLLFGVQGYSQKKYELGNVTVEELMQKTHPIDTSAVAAVLFEKAQDRVQGLNSINIVRNVKKKIKIYKKEGYNYGNFQLDYFFSNSSRQWIDFTNVATYNLVDGKVVKTKLKSDGEFDERINKYTGRKKISLPNVKEGSIVEFEYTLKSPPNYAHFEKWYFQSEIPTNYSEYTTIIPEFYVYKSNINGFFTPKILKEVDNFAYQTNGESINRIYTGNVVNSYLINKTTYIFEDLQAFKKEQYVSNINNYLSSVEYELSMTRYPLKEMNFATDWETITKSIYENQSFGVELNKTGYFEEDITTLISGLNTQNEKISAILNFVKAKVKWNKYNGYHCDDGVKTAYKNGIGNTAEINLMLTAMLRFAEIDANPILVSTRSNGISFFPSRNAYNYVIVGIEVQDDVILLDATDSNSMPDILPIRDLNWYGRIIRKNCSSANIDLMSKKKSSEVINVIATIAPDGIVEGKVRDQYYDYNAYLFRDYYGSITEESYLETLEKNYNNIEVEDYSITGKKQLDEPIVENYSFKTSNSVEIIGDKMIFSPLLFFAIDENPFKTEKREYPVDFIFPNQDRFLINLTIPDGYTVEKLPSSVSIPMSDNLINAKYIISTNENKIQISYTKEKNTPIILPEYYNELRAVYAEIFKKENEKIVLKKI